MGGVVGFKKNKPVKAEKHRKKNNFLFCVSSRVPFQPFVHLLFSFFLSSSPNTDEFTSNTLRSAHSHVTEVSSVMTANVSDPASSGGQAAAVQDQGPVVNTNVHRTSCQMSPPQPVSTLQHNYSNIQQPAPLVSLAILLLISNLPNNLFCLVQLIMLIKFQIKLEMF